MTKIAQILGIVCLILTAGSFVVALLAVSPMLFVAINGFSALTSLCMLIVAILQNKQGSKGAKAAIALNAFAFVASVGIILFMIFYLNISATYVYH